jgi:hypothetical protein
MSAQLPRALGSGVVGLGMSLIAAVQRHFLILVGVEDLTALFTLDVFHIVFARYHAHLGMLADWLHDQFGGLDGLPA